MPRIVFILFFVAALLGCRPDRPATDFTAATSVANARVQGDLDGAMYGWAHLERYVKSRGKVLWESIGYHLRNGQAHSAEVDVQLTMAGGQARKNWEDLQASRSIVKRYETDFFSPRQRKLASRIIAWTIGIYMGLGALSVVFGLFGFMGWSKLITTNMLFMGPFVRIRDWLIKRKQDAAGTTNTTTVNIQAPPAQVSIEAPPQVDIQTPVTPTERK